MSCWIAGPLLLLTLISKPDAELRRLQRACDRGAREACQELGQEIYNHAEDVRNMRRALAIFRRNCEGDHGPSCASAARVAAEDAIDDIPAALAFARRACELGETDGCMDVIRGLPAEDGKRRAGTRAEALAALARLEALCGPLSGACWLAADVQGRGMPGVLEPDRPGALRLLQAGCAAGQTWLCDALRRAGEPPPSQQDVDDLRDFLVRQQLPELVRQQLRARDRDRDRQRVWCVAVASDTSNEGEDPGPGLWQRLTDVPSVRPVSWCREQREGTIVSLGPVSSAASWPPAEGLATWVVTYAWDGQVHAGAQRLAKREGKWTPVHVAIAGRPQAPEIPTTDHVGDRRGIAAVVAALVEAWNRGEELPVRDRMSDDEVIARHLREHTRLLWEEPEAKFDSKSPWGLTANLEMPLLGTFEPRPGARWPIEPWKPSGSRTSVRLELQRISGWWREGDWAVRSITVPWGSTVVDIY